MRVVIADAAKFDLIDIGDYVRAHNRVRAATFVNELLDRCYDLAEQPLAYPLIQRYEHHGIRFRAYRDYGIFYRIQNERIEVLRVLNSARDYEALLFGY